MVDRVKEIQTEVNNFVDSLRRRGFGLVADGTVYGDGVWIDRLTVRVCESDTHWIDTPESSNLEGFGYNEQSLILSVRFKGSAERGVYEYLEVPKEIYEEMVRSRSRGSYFSRTIKSQYICRAPEGD